VLNVTAQNNTALNTNVGTLIAKITGAGSTLSVNELNNLTVSGNLTTSNGAINVNVASGNLVVPGLVNAGVAGNVTLSVASGDLNVTGQVSGNVLTVTANSAAALNTNVGILNANITGPGSSLTVTEADNLTIGSGNVRTNNGQINITTSSGGSLVRTGVINAGTANVTLNLAGGTSGNGLVLADRLTLQAVGSSSVNTTINTVLANVTGSGSPLAIFQTGKDLVVPAGDVRTNNGALTLSADGVNNLTVLGNVTAGTAPVTLNAGGAVNASTGQISGGTLNVAANTTSALNTAVTTLNANITGAGAALTVTEADNLTIGSGNVRTNNGQINITTSSGGSLVRTGAINAGTANVTLNLAGGTSGTGVVGGNQLNLAAGTASTLNTAVTTVVANAASGSLTIVDVDGLAIGAGGVTTNANVSITAQGGSLNGTGIVKAGNAVELTNTNGSVQLASVANQVVAGGIVTVNATDTSAVNTRTGTLAANISGSGKGLTVSQTGPLSLGNVTSNNGTLTFNVNGGMNGAGLVSAGTGGFVVMNAASGGILLTAANQVTASGLTVNALNSSTISTSVTTLNAKISGSGQTLTVSEANGLTVGSNGIAANGNVNLTLAAGPLNGTGVINAGSANVTLNVAGGGISPLGTVTGNVLTLRALNSSTLVTNITTLNANVTGAAQSLTVTDANGVAIGSGNIVTNNGNLTINATAGSINGTGRISTGTGNVTLRTPAGNVTLNSSANQITANALTISALNSSAVNTSVTSLDAAISGTGSLTVNEANNIAITQARTTNGAINFTTSANSAVNITSINAATGTGGNVTFVNGNLFVAAPGLRATQTIDLRQAQSVTVLNGSINAPVVLLPTGQSTVNFLVQSNSDSGAGSLRDVITRINAGGGIYNSTIVVTSPTTITLASALPAMTVQMNVQGNNNLTLVGTNAGNTTSGFTITSKSATPSTISGVAFQNFSGAGIDLIGARTITVTNVTVTGSAIGFRASGNLTGSSIVSSTFTNNVIGAVLTGAQNLNVGRVGQGNAFNGGTGFRGASTTGMSISGNSTGTFVRANAFNRYPTAISLVAATGLTVGGNGPGEGNTISNASTAGIYATGFCTSSSVIKTTFGAGVTSQYAVSTSRGLTIIR
jgi:hypothetical protein